MAITTLLPFPPGEDSGEGLAFAVASRVGRIVPGSLWPGFDPASAQGVRRITVTGIPDEPQVGSKGGSLSIRAKGITADFRGARIVTEGQALTVVLEDVR